MRYSWVGFANRRTQSECRANGLRNGTDFRRPALSASPARSPHPMHPTVGAGFPTCTPRPWANTAGKKPAATSDTPTTVLSRTEPVVFQPFRSRDLDGQPNNDFMQRRHSREKRRRKGKEAWCGTITVIRPQPLNGESGRKEIARGREEKFQRFFRASFFGLKTAVFRAVSPIAGSVAKRHKKTKRGIREMRIGVRRWLAWWRRLTAGRGTHRSLTEFVGVFESEPMGAEPRRTDCGDRSEETVVGPAAFDRLRATGRGGRSSLMDSAFLQVSQIRIAERFRSQNPHAGLVDCRPRNSATRITHAKLCRFVWKRRHSPSLRSRNHGARATVR